MKIVAAIALIASVGAVEKDNAYPLNLDEMFPNKVSLYASDWAKYKHTRQLQVDCDIYESENWLGTGKCKYSWECRGARMCEGQGWCYGDDACSEVHE